MGIKRDESSGLKKEGKDSPSTYMFLVAEGNFATIPSTSLVRNT
jgi:hypothetical protein